MGDELRLRDVEEADLEFFFQAEHDPENVRRSKFTPRDRDRFMAHWHNRVLADPTNFAQTVTVDGEPAGNIGAWWERDRRFIGYVFARPYWGRGIGTESVRLFLDQEKVRPLYAEPYVGNTASVRLLERLGFERIGSERYDEHEHLLYRYSGRVS